MKQLEIKETFSNWREIVRNYQMPDTSKAIWQIVNTFVPFLGICALMYWSLDYSYWTTLALGILNSFLLVRIFIIQHDCGHQSFLDSKIANDIIGRICAFFSLIPYRYWAKSHSYHHAHNAQLGHSDIGDVTTLTVEQYRNLSKWDRFKYRLYRSPLIMFTIGPVYYIVIHSRLPLISLKGWNKERASVLRTNIYLVLFYAILGYLIGYATLLKLYAPILVTFSIIAIWFFYVQHQHNPNYKQPKESWEYLMAAIKGSTYYKLPKVMHWLTGNIGFHHIHHLNSKIPNYNLAKCHKENPIFDELAVKMTFWESFTCLFNKLWDEEKDRMISFRQFYKLEKDRMMQKA